MNFAGFYKKYSLIVIMLFCLSGAIKTVNAKVWLEEKRVVSQDGQEYDMVQFYGTVKVLNLAHEIPNWAAKNQVKAFEIKINNALSKIDEIEKRVFQSDIKASLVTSMHDVAVEDHLIVFVDNIQTEEGILGRCVAAGIADMFGLIAYVDTSFRTQVITAGAMPISDLMVHEFGHNLGLGHVSLSWTNIGNYMTEGIPPLKDFNIEQVYKVYRNVMEHPIWSGNSMVFDSSQHEPAPLGITTNRFPYKNETVKDGDKIPNLITD